MLRVSSQNDKENTMNLISIKGWQGQKMVTVIVDYREEEKSGGTYVDFAIAAEGKATGFHIEVDDFFQLAEAIAAESHVAVVRHHKQLPQDRTGSVINEGDMLEVRVPDRAYAYGNPNLESVLMWDGESIQSAGHVWMDSCMHIKFDLDGDLYTFPAEQLEVVGKADDK
jgi:hypothetical protein